MIYPNFSLSKYPKKSQKAKFSISGKSKKQVQNQNFGLVWMPLNRGMDTNDFVCLRPEVWIPPIRGMDTGNFSCLRPVVWIPPIRGIHTKLSDCLGAICMDTLHQRYPYQSEFSYFHALVPPWSNVMLPDFLQSTFNQFSAFERDGGCLITPGFTGSLCELET